MLIRSLRSLFSAASIAVLLLSGSTAMFSQAINEASSAGLVPVPSRITATIDNAKRVTLAGTMHPLAQAGNDRGVLEDATQLNRIHVVLKRSDAQETALKQLIGDMHDPSSPSYHKWLTPDQFGKQFGPSDEDIAAVQTWLTSQGFTVGKLNPGHQTLEISGSAGTFKKAFNAEVHKYQVNGETHYANAGEPQIPAALAPVFGGFASLNNFRLKSYAKPLGEANYDTATKKVEPKWTTGGSSGLSFALSPADYAVQYDLPAASTGTTGAGQTIAVINESNINVYLVNQFRSLFGLPVNPPQIIVDGQDPGVDGINNIDGPNYASVEAYLDVEWAGATAPNATIDLVIGADTELENGLSLAMERAVYSNLAPIMSISFGLCEKSQGSGNQFFNSLWQQAAAQGITVLVSSGDNGSAGCDNDNTQEYAVGGQAVNGLASTPYNVAVGGTDFYYSQYNQGNAALLNQLGGYWNLTPSNTTPTVSIKGYIPEQPWNNSQYGLSASSAVAAPTNIVGGGGGASTCGIYTSTTCAPYPKPSWQTGTGVPADGARDLPDVSLFASNGQNYSFYPICATDGDCQPVSSGGTIQIFGVGGTSASTPAFAGIMALVNQKFGRQGQANYTLYPLAKQFPAAFHDVTVGTNSVPCNVSTTTGGTAAKGCIAVSSPITATDSTYGTAVEGQIGTGTTPQYNATAGYDLASGLGTIDANVMLANWNKVTFAASSTTLTPSQTSFAHGTAVTISGAVTGSGTPSGTVALMTDSNTPLQQAQAAFPLASGSYSQSINYLPGGTYNIYGQYSGDGVNAASTSPKTAITVTPESAGIALNVLTSYYNTSGNYTTSLLSSGGSLQYGQATALSALIAPTAQLTAYTNCVFGSGTCPSFGTATGSVMFTDNSSVVNTGQLDAEGEAEFNYAPSVGSHSTTAAYSGDASYNAVTSSAFTYTVTKNTPSFGLYGTSTNTVSQQTVLTLEYLNSVSTIGLAAAPTGTVTISGGPTGTPSSATLTQGVDPSTGAPVGIATVVVPAGIASNKYTMTFAYSGDANYNAVSNSSSVTFGAAGSGLTSTTTGVVSSNLTTPSARVTLSATVTGQSGKAAPTGTLIAYAGGYKLASVTITSGSSNISTATFQFSSASLLQGANMFTLQYSGDGTYLPSTGTVSISNNLSDFTINPVATNVTIPATPGTVTDTVNITSTNGFTGSVALSCSAAGGITCSLSPTSVTLTSGQTLPVTLTLNGTGVTTAGTYAVSITGSDATSKYVHVIGLQVYSPKISTSPDFTVAAASNSLTVAVPNTVTDVITVGSTNSFNSAVAMTCAAPAGVTCSMSPTPVTPASGGTTTSTLSVTGVTAGTYNVVVTGTSGTLVHTATVVVTVTPSVTPDFTLSAASTAVSIVVPNTVTDLITVGSTNSFNSAVALTCTGAVGVTCSLTPTPVTPASGGTTTSTLSLTGVAAGTYTVVVTGTSGTLMHSVNVQVTVTTPDFTISAASSTASPVVGGTATDVITVGSTNTFSKAVALTCAGPAGVTCSLNPTSVTPASGGSSTSTLTLIGVTPGTYTVVVTGTSGTLVHSVNITVTVPTPDFAVGAASLTASVFVGATTTDNITVVDLNGYATAVALTCSAPTGVTCSLAPASVNPATGTGTSVLTLTGVTPGTYNVVVTGTSGALTPHTVTIAVTVPTPGFMLSASPSSLSVIQGNSGTSTISVAATNGFTASVGLTCSAPSGITCSLATATVTPGGTSVLTMTSSATSAKMERGPGFFGVAGGTALAALVCFLIPIKRRRWPALLAVMLCAAALGLTTGCGGGGTPVQSASYTVTVTGSSGTLTGTTSVALTVTNK